MVVLSLQEALDEAGIKIPNDAFDIHLKDAAQDVSQLDKTR